MDPIKETNVRNNYDTLFDLISQLSFYRVTFFHVTELFLLSSDEIM